MSVLKGDKFYRRDPALFKKLNRLDAEVAAPSAPGSIDVYDEGVLVLAGAQEMDFVGANVVATAGGVRATVTVTGGTGSGGFDWGKYIGGFNRFPMG